MNLVLLTTQDISKAATFTTSRKVAEEFGKQHKDVLRKIDSLISDESAEFFNQRNFTPVEYMDAKGEKRKEYNLNRDQFIFVVMGFTGKKANEVKTKFIKAFNFMEHELLVRSGTRNIGKQVRHSMTDSISNNLEDNTAHKKYAYSNYSKLIYKTVIGCTVKKFKEKNGLTESANIRDFLTVSDLERVQALESKVAVLIEGFKSEFTDKEVYAKIKALVEASK